MRRSAPGATPTAPRGRSQRAFNGNVGRSVAAFYENLLAEVKGKFPAVFTDKGQAEFNLEYEVREKNVSAQTTSKTTAKVPVNQARDTSVPSAK